MYYAQFTVIHLVIIGHGKEKLQKRTNYSRFLNVISIHTSSIENITQNLLKEIKGYTLPHELGKENSFDVEYI